MRISTSQIDALQMQQHDKFVSEMVDLMASKDPFHARALGPNGLKDAVVFGISRARADGITQRDPVRVYLQLMFFLGGRFSEDPLLEWVQPILRDTSSLPTQVMRMEALRKAAISYLRSTCGRDGGPLRLFLRNCLNHYSEKLDDVPESEIVAFLERSYPLKAGFFGPSILARLVTDSTLTCRRAGLESSASVFGFTALRFVYGTAVSEDPLFPWLHRLFWQDTTSSDKDQKFHVITNKFLQSVHKHVSTRESGYVG